MGERRGNRSSVVAGLLALGGVGASGCAASLLAREIDAPPAETAAGEAGQEPLDDGPQEPDLRRWSGRPPVVALDVIGPATTTEKIARCDEMAATYGIRLDDGAELRATLTLDDDDGNWLTVSRSEGGEELYSEARPGWSMRDLCRDALAYAVELLRRDRERDRPAGSSSPTAASRAGDLRATPPLRTEADDQRRARRAQARGLHEEAKQHFREQRYAEAIDAWLGAYDLDPRPQFLFNVGSAFRHRGERTHHIADLRRARSYFHRYIDAVRGAEVDPEWMQRLDREIARLERERPAAREEENASD